MVFHLLKLSTKIKVVLPIIPVSVVVIDILSMHSACNSYLWQCLTYAAAWLLKVCIEVTELNDGIL